jgi:hypothetical protein
MPGADIVGFECPKSIATTAGLFSGGGKSRRKCGGKSRKNRSCKKGGKKGGYRPKKPKTKK